MYPGCEPRLHPRPRDLRRLPMPMRGSLRRSQSTQRSQRGAWRLFGSAKPEKLTTRTCASAERSRVSRLHCTDKCRQACDSYHDICVQLFNQGPKCPDVVLEASKNKKYSNLPASLQLRSGRVENDHCSKINMNCS